MDINKMAIWFKANKLAVNKGKTKYIIFHSKGKKIIGNLPDVVINENEPNLPNDPNSITVLERYHNKHRREMQGIQAIRNLFGQKSDTGPPYKIHS
jgi:hypothetical protein